MLIFDVLNMKHGFVIMEHFEVFWPYKNKILIYDINI